MLTSPLQSTDFAAAATRFQQEQQVQNLEVELLRKSIEMTKEQSVDLLGLLSPQHLGQHVDARV